MESAACSLSRDLVVERLDSLEALLRFENEWAKLYDDCLLSTPFQHPDWAIPWAKAFAPSAVRAFALRTREGMLVGLAPWFRYERGKARVLTALGGGHADHHELLVHPDFADAASRSLVETLAATTRDWDLCELEQLSPDSPLYRAELPPGLVDLERSAGAPSPMLRLPTRGDPLATVIPTHQLARYRKYRRRAERLGRLTLESATLETCEEMFQSFLELHEACWKGRGQDGMAADEPVRAFHREVVQRMARRGSLRLYALRSGDRTMASLYGYWSKRKLYCYWQGFDPEYAQSSPGMLLVGAVIEAAAAEGAIAVDFLRGEETYKFRWGAKSEPAHRRRIGHRSSR